MRLLREYTESEAERMSASELENKIKRLKMRAKNLEPDNPGAAQAIYDTIEDLQVVLKNKKGTIVSSRQYDGPGLNEIRQLVRFMINEAKKKEAKEPKKHKRKPKLEEQEQMWGGRRSRWYMPRLSDY